MSKKPGVFLSAKWLNLVMMNFKIKPDVLDEYLPRGTELDDFQGDHFVSLVAFQFLDSKVLGLKIPFHQNFVELNLRFYVRREVAGELRRGVVFIKEIAPRRIISWAARRFYNENYTTLPMRYVNKVSGDESSNRIIRYQWKVRSQWNHIELQATKPLFSAKVGSEENFITEHFWGYSSQRDGSTLEYQVRHPSWKVANARTSHLDCSITYLYGKQFEPYLSCPASSVILVDGSEVTVGHGQQIC